MGRPEGLRYVARLSVRGGMSITEGKKNRIGVFLSKHRHLIVVVFFILVFSIQFFHFVLHNTVIPTGDDIAHGAWTARIFRVFLGQRDFILLHRLSYPPLVYLLNCFFFAIAGLNPVSALLSIYVFSLIFLISLYLLGNRLGGEAGGIASMMLGLSIPYFTYFGERFFLDLPGSAICLLCLYFLLKTDGFMKKKESLIFGVTLALAQLTKWNCATFIVPPILAILLWKCRKSLKASATAIISLGVSAGLAFYYYFLGTASLKAENDTGRITILHYVIFISVCCAAIVILWKLSKKVQDSADTPEKDALSYSINGNLAIFIGQLPVYPFYLFGIKAYFTHFMHQKEFITSFNATMQPASYFFALTWSFPLALLLVSVGIIFMFFHREKLSDFGLIILSMITGYIFTIKSSPLDPRYFLTIYGLMAILGGYWTGYLKKLSWVVVGIISLMPVMIFSNYFTGIPHLPIILRSPPLVEQITPVSVLKPIPQGIMKPDNGDYRFKDLMDCIRNNYSDKYRGRSPQDLIHIELVITEGFRNFSEENHLSRIRHDSLAFALEYYGGRDDRFSSMDTIPDDVVKKVIRPVYIIVFYVNPEEIEEIRESLQKSSERASHLLCDYPIPGGRKAGVLMVEPGEGF